jgi:hypothetical protein
MLTLFFILLFITVTAITYYREKRKQLALEKQLKEKQKEVWLNNFYSLIREYDSCCVRESNDSVEAQVCLLNEKLRNTSKFLDRYYPGFTPPTLK